MPHDYFTSLIRTYVPVWISAALVWLATRYGIVLDEASSAAAAVAAVGVVTALYYAAARAIEASFPALGRILLALGLAKGEPVYTEQRTLR